MDAKEPVTPDPEAEAQAAEWVEQEIAEERAREAPVDERIWEQESAAIERMEAAGTDSSGAPPAPGGAAPRGLLARIRSMLGLG